MSNTIADFLQCLAAAMVIVSVPAGIWFFQVVREKGHPIQQIFSSWLWWRWRIGQVAGFPIYVHISVFFWLFFIDLNGTFREYVSRIGLVLISVLFHELGHAISCRVLGFGSGSITLWYWGGFFVPTSLGRMASQLYDHEKKRYIAMALAGPFTNLLLAGLFYLVNIWVDYVWLEQAITLNLALGLLNLLPAPGLDGGTAFTIAGTFFFEWQHIFRVLAIIWIIFGLSACAGALVFDTFPATIAFLAFLLGIFALKQITRPDSETQDLFENFIKQERKFIGEHEPG